MLVAYLRGLLKPDYPHGIRSMLRENFILKALGREIESNELIDKVKAESCFASILQPSQANKLLKHHDKMLSLAYSSLAHELAKNKTLVNYDVDSLDKFIETYKKLATLGILGDKKKDDVL